MADAANGGGAAIRRLTLYRYRRADVWSTTNTFRAFGWIGGFGVCALSFLVAAVAAAGPSSISTKLTPTGPAWLAGPLAGLVSLPSPAGVNRFANIALPLMFVFYVVALAGSHRLSAKAAFGLVVVAQIFSSIGPPTVLTDQFIYLQEGRMWVVQHLNPFLAVIDDVPRGGLLFSETSWRSLQDTYGQLFTLLMAPISTLPLAVASWVTRATMLVASLATVWLCGLCAREVRGVPSRAIMVIGLNPLIVFYTVGGAHNDFLAVLPVAAALLLVLRSRNPEVDSTPLGLRAIGDRWLRSEVLCFAAGLLLVIGVGMKASVVVCAPAIVIAARHRFVALLGVAAAGVVLWAITAACFGGYLPNVTTQGEFTNNTSIGSILGVTLGLGGDTNMLRLMMEMAAAGIVACTAFTAWRRPHAVGDAATWAGVALVVAVGWLEPWYMLLCLATLSASRSRTIWIVCLALSAVILLGNLPDGEWLRGCDNSILNILHSRVDIPFVI